MGTADPSFVSSCLIGGWVGAGGIGVACHDAKFRHRQIEYDTGNRAYEEKERRQVKIGKESERT